MKIKTRFAPSPTGYLHIGSLRTALYSYLYAKQHGGDFVLRIEDTDRARYVEGAEIKLIEVMQKMGLNADEGPMLDNDHKLAENGQNGPYFQSKRLKIYQEYIQKLIADKNAYYCFCSSDRLAKLRADQEANHQPTKYDGLCRKLTESEIQQKLANHEPYVIRLKVPEHKPIVFNDAVRGEIKIDSSEVDDQVLIKSDGFPTYHFAVVVDDHLMNVTHIIRGEEWLPSTPKQVLLYDFFGWTIPVFAHLPLLLNFDKSKLSKRQGDVSVEDYLAKGYLPEAIINYVALLGWHPQDNNEFFSLADLIKKFDLTKIQKAGAIFDQVKLNWFNNHYLNQKDDADLATLAKNFLPDVEADILTKIIHIQKPRLEYFDQLKDAAQFFIKLPDYQSELLIFKKSDREKTLKSLKLIYENLTDLDKWEVEDLHHILNHIVVDNVLTNGDVFWPTRVAVSGLEKSPSPEEIMWVIGKDESLNRIAEAIKKIE